MRRGRLLIAAIVAVISLISYYSLRQENPFTGEVQHIALDPQQEIALGLQMAPQMAQEMGGEDDDAAVRRVVEQVGNRVVAQGGASHTPYQFQFHALADPQTVNAFALPGGQIFITRGLLARLENEAQLAGVLAHEVGHVVARHSAEQISKSELAQGLVGAAGIAGSGDYDSGQHSAQVAALVAQMMQLRYGRQDETQADTLGVRMMAGAGYDPRAMIVLMQILEQASGGGGQPEFMNSHPDPGNRRQVIEAAIHRNFPNGVPADLGLGATFASEGHSAEPEPQASTEP
jgi:beta-barrel assembly-enhancing protease